jgi:hypothetical protein
VGADRRVPDGAAFLVRDRAADPRERLEENDRVGRAGDLEMHDRERAHANALRRVAAHHIRAVAQPETDLALRVRDRAALAGARG